MYGNLRVAILALSGVVIGCAGSVEFAPEWATVGLRNGKLISEVRSPGRFVTDWVELRSPSGVTAIQADIIVHDIAVPNKGHSQARLLLKIYNDGTSKTSGVGDIGAQISVIKVFGSTPYIRLSIFRCGDLQCTAVGAKSLSRSRLPRVTPMLGQTVTLSVGWDGALVTFGVDGQKVVIDASDLAPIARAEPDLPFAVISTSASGLDSRVAATLDNVEVNGSLFDDFSGDQLDASKWSRH